MRERQGGRSPPSAEVANTIVLTPMLFSAGACDPGIVDLGVGTTRGATRATCTTGSSPRSSRARPPPAERTLAVTSGLSDRIGGVHHLRAATPGSYICPPERFPLASGERCPNPEVSICTPETSSLVIALERDECVCRIAGCCTGSIAALHGRCGCFRQTDLTEYILPRCFRPMRGRTQPPRAATHEGCGGAGRSWSS